MFTLKCSTNSDTKKLNETCFSRINANHHASVYICVSVYVCLYIYIYTPAVDSDSAYISVKKSTLLFMLPCFENCLVFFYQEKMAHKQHVLYQLLKALWYACLTLQPIKPVGENLIAEPQSVWFFLETRSKNLEEEWPICILERNKSTQRRLYDC